MFSHIFRVVIKEGGNSNKIGGHPSRVGTLMGSCLASLQKDNTGKNTSESAETQRFGFIALLRGTAETCLILLFA